jgi:RNA polymerase sigma-70 factor (ECF subfamily)
MASVQIPDALLVKNYVAGDETALSTLINRHQSKIYGFIYSKISDRDLSDDIFQDTFIKVIKTLKSNSYNEEGKFLPWVMRIAHNLIIDHFRRNKKMPMYRETEEFSIFSIMTDNSLTVENQMITDQVEKDLKKLIEELPQDQTMNIIIEIDRYNNPIIQTIDVNKKSCWKYCFDVIYDYCCVPCDRICNYCDNIFNHIIIHRF